MNLSARANEFWNSLGRSTTDEHFSAVEEFFRANDLPLAAPFIQCVARAGGMTLDVPTDRITFFSTADLERLAKTSVRASFFFDDPDWYYACDSWYQGNNCLHRSGSFHFECDPDEIWANSLAEIIESAALLWSVGKSTLKFHANAIFKAPSLATLGEWLQTARDPDASSPLREFYCYRGGIVTACRIHEFEKNSACGMQAVLPTREAAWALMKDLKGHLSAQSIGPIRIW